MKKLRSGYTTGACAAAAAKAATLLLVSGMIQDSVEIPFPDGSRVRFNLVHSGFMDSEKSAAMAAVIKDAGDDPDVTNGARIEASVCYGKKDSNRGESFHILGGWE